MSDHFATTIRLPPHRLEIEEAIFFASSPVASLSLHTIEKQHAILRGFDKLSQFQVDELIREFEHELREQEARNLMEAGKAGKVSAGAGDGTGDGELARMPASCPLPC